MAKRTPVHIPKPNQKLADELGRVDTLLYEAQLKVEEANLLLHSLKKSGEPKVKDLWEGGVSVLRTVLGHRSMVNLLRDAVKPRPPSVVRSDR